MQRVLTTRALVEEITSYGNTITLTCQTPKRKVFSTPITYDESAPRHSSRYQKWRLLKAMAAAYDVSIETSGFVTPGPLIGCFFKFRLVEWNGYLLIDAFKRCEPFDLPTEADKVANFEACLREASDAVS